MATLIILRGNSGSGKTSVANILQRTLGRNTLLISQDIIRREMLYVNDGKDTEALPLLITLLEYGKSYCEYVILEGILNANWYKQLFETAIELYNENIYAYYYNIPFEETLRRHETKDKRREFGATEMHRWWKEKDFIGIIPEKIFEQDVSLEDAVRTILKDTSFET